MAVQQEMKRSLFLSPPSPRSCVSIWTAGGWTAGWDSASFCSTSSSSSAPSALRSCRGHVHTLPTHRSIQKGLTNKCFPPSLLPLSIKSTERRIFISLHGGCSCPSGCLKAALFTFDKRVFYTVLYRAPLNPDVVASKPTDNALCLTTNL